MKNHVRQRRLNAQIQQKLHHLQQLEAQIAHQTGACTLQQLKNQQDRPLNQTFIEFCEHSLEQERSRIAHSSWKNFRQTINYLREFSPKMAFRDISTGTIHDFKNFLFQKGLRHNTVQKHYRFFRKYVRLAVRQQLLQEKDNPFNHLRMAAKKTDIVFLTEEEFHQMIAYEPPANRPLWQHVHQCFLLCCYTGLRFCDLCQLTDDNFYETEEGFFCR